MTNWRHRRSSDAKLYNGSFHDLLSDSNKQVVLSDIRGWVDARLPAW